MVLYLVPIQSKRHVKYIIQNVAQVATVLESKTCMQDLAQDCSRLKTQHSIKLSISAAGARGRMANLRHLSPTAPSTPAFESLVARMMINGLGRCIIMNGLACPCRTHCAGVRQSLVKICHARVCLACPCRTQWEGVRPSLVKICPLKY